MTPRLYVTGTDTDVGKTTVTGALAGAIVARHGRATVVKIVQTGISPAGLGDADIAAAAAACEALELARFAKAADPWTAALAAGAPPLRAEPLAQRIADIAGPIVAEGLGGAAVPLNESETITDVARRAGLDSLVVVGVRLGCINHAILTLEFLRRSGIRTRGVVLSVRWPDTANSYVEEVEHVIRNFSPVLGVMRFQQIAPATEVGLDILRGMEAACP
ncbi:MAG TPA: dethiobiotin synthase [Candidatus Lustribacter sp.]